MKKTNKSVLEVKIWIYWSESISYIYFIYIYLIKNWKIYWSEESFTGLFLDSSSGLINKTLSEPFKKIIIKKS